MQRHRRYQGVGVLFGLVALFTGSVAYATPPISSSDNYQMVDSGFEGTAGTTGCSDSYCSQTGGVAGSDTPILAVTVDPGQSDLGTVSVQQPATKTATVTIKNYLSYGYTMQIVGNPPTYHGHTITTPTTPTSLQSGIEQFGINVVKNTSPAVGADPVQSPADQAEFGVVNSGYNTPNQFQYQSGDTVAHGISTMQAMGQTSYTISMVLSISNVTPAGQYTTDLSVVVVPVY